MADKACVRLDDEILERRRRVSRRFVDASRWKRAMQAELRLLTWRYLRKATGLAIPVAIGVLVAFALTGGGLPISADIAASPVFSLFP